jgi:hypothetical protein
MNLKADDVVAGWSAAQWITVLRGLRVPALNLAAATKFRLTYLQTSNAPEPYSGKDIEIELNEASLILESAR